MPDIKYIESIQEKILINSYLYYEKGESLISDSTYDAYLSTYHAYHKKEEDINTKYYYAFEGFEGDTGFDLIHKLTFLDRVLIQDKANFQYKEKMRKSKEDAI